MSPQPRPVRPSARTLLGACVLLCLLLAGGCAEKRVPPPGEAEGSRLATRQGAVTDKKAAAVIRTARSLLGVRYKWGGDSPKTGFDCSGLAWYAFTRNGVSLPRLSWQQFGAGSPVGGDLRPGDLIFHQVDKKKSGLHVGIVTDRGTFIHAPSTGKKVMESPIANPYWREHYLGARRVLE